MSRSTESRRPRRTPRAAVFVIAGLAGAAIAVAAGLASASSFTLRVQKNAHVTNITNSPVVNKHEAIAIGPKGVAVYMLGHATTTHLLCVTKTTGPMCLTFWPPATVKSTHVTKPVGIKGKLGTFHRKGYGLQLELNGHPLYYFKPDLMKHNPAIAQGDLVKNSGTWHVVTADGGTPAASTSPAATMPTTTMTTTTTTYPY
jgi:predicted lipoprotein with Yx(FWY)xxD motif